MLLSETKALHTYKKQHQSIMSQAIAHRSCSTIAEAQAELHWNGEDWQQHPSLCHRFSSMHIPRYANRQDGNPWEERWKIADVFPKYQHAHLNRRTYEFVASLQTHCIQCSRLAWSANVATRNGRYGAIQNWIHYGWDDPDFANEGEIYLASGQSHWSRRWLVTHSRIQDVWWTEQVSLLSNPIQRSHVYTYIELPAKLICYFLRSNKSNINQLRTRCYHLIF